MLKANPDSDTLVSYISEFNSTIAELGTNDDSIEKYSEIVENTQTLTIVINDYITLLRVASNNETGIKYLMKHIMEDVVIPDPTLESFENDYSFWRATWYLKLNNLENLIQQLPEFSENEKKELGNNTIINTKLLERYDINDKMNILAKLRRSKVSDINVIEKMFFLLFGKYCFTAWFSLGLAVFFDISSLLAGLFIYGICKKKSTT